MLVCPKLAFALAIHDYDQSYHSPELEEPQKRMARFMASKLFSAFIASRCPHNFGTAILMHAFYLHVLVPYLSNPCGNV